MAQDQANTQSKGRQTVGQDVSDNNKDADRVGTHGNKHSDFHTPDQELNSDTRAGVTKGRSAEWTSKSGLVEGLPKTGKQ